MELTLKRLLEQAKFTTTRKGYDQDEVDDFLDRAVAMATKVEARLTQALADADKGGAAAPAPAEAPSGRSDEEIQAEIASEVEKRVQIRVAELEAAAPKAAEVDDTAAAEEAARTLLLAQRTADAAVAEAKEEAEQIKAAAQTEADRERSEARGRLADEIHAMEGVRDGLRADVSTLEGHVEEQRLQLRSTVAELQRLLEDPAAFRVAPAPAVRDVQLPGLGDDSSESASAAPAAPAPAATPSPAAGDSGPTGSAPAGATSPEPAVVEPPSSSGTESAGSPAEADDPEASLDVGPPTAPVPAIEISLGVDDPIAVASSRSEGVAPAGPSSGLPTDGDDAFLAELRKAMADEEPLGPRDTSMGEAQPSFLDDERRGWRFGKRR